MQKVEPMQDSNPFLKFYEVISKPHCKIISDVKKTHMKFDAEGKDSYLIDVELKEIPSEDVYKTLGMKSEEIEARRENNKRTLRMNGQTINHFIDKYGSESSEWAKKSKDFIEFEVVDINGYNAIIPKGSEAL